MSTSAPLQRGDLVPHFTVRSVNGDTVRYAAIWQSEQLVLIVLPDVQSSVVEQYVGSLAAHEDEFSAHESRCVVTRDGVPGLVAPAALVADRWGEIAHVTYAADVAGLPAARELLDWIQYVQHKCPECEGEAH
jgi:peroxiredoxin